jgi:peptidoglycan/LPS O-acetylase OafA/YrhL
MSGNEYRLGYRSDVEGLRAVAILLVVADHAGVPWLGGGFVGVDVFFVLSGFLITGLLVQEITDAGGLRFAEFYVRRLRRLLPALVVMLLVVSILAALLLAPGEQLGQASAAVSAVMWLSNIHFAFAQLGYFAPSTETNLFLHTWSLGVEEQFYLIWPALLLWLLGRDGDRGIARLKVGMLTVIAISLVACVVLTYKAPQLAFYLMPLRAWQFSAGALVWLYFKTSGHGPATNRLQGRFDTLLRWAGWLGLAMIAASGLLLDAKLSYPGAYSLLPTVGAVCVISAGSRDSQAGVSWLLSWWPLQVIGRVSYSWYLWHWPVLLLGHTLMGLDSPVYRVTWVVLSLMLAVLSYRYIESPIRRQQRWLVRRWAAILGVLVLMAVANVLCINWYSRAFARMHSPEQQRYAMAQVDAPIIYIRGTGCDDWYRSDRVHICAFGPTNALHTAVLMGDSVAGQWFPAVVKVFDKPGWRLLVLTKSACPMVDVPIFYNRIGRMYTECSTWRKHSLEQVAGIKPDVVLLSTVSTDDFTQAQWVEGTTRVLGAIMASSGHIYVLRGTPPLPFDGPNCLAEHVGRPAWLGFGRACSASSTDEHADLVYQWLQQASRHFDNVKTIDMNDLICPNGTCAAEQNGKIVFRDSQHMTATFAASLGPALEDRLDLKGFSEGDRAAGTTLQTH